MEKLAYSIPEVVAATGLGRTSVYSEMDSGRLASVKVGKRRLITVEALKAWLAALPQAEPSK